jgi:hypothetical protein
MSVLFNTIDVAGDLNKDKPAIEDIKKILSRTTGKDF